MSGCTYILIKFTINFLVYIFFYQQFFVALSSELTVCLSPLYSTFSDLISSSTCSTSTPSAFTLTSSDSDMGLSEFSSIFRTVFIRRCHYNQIILHLKGETIASVFSSKYTHIISFTFTLPVVFLIICNQHSQTADGGQQLLLLGFHLITHVRQLLQCLWASSSTLLCKVAFRFAFFRWL